MKKIKYNRIALTALLVLIPVWGQIENFFCDSYEVSCKLFSSKKDSIETSDYNALIIGGSNVVNGIMMPLYFNGPFIFYNAGLNYEGGNFDNYLSFLSKVRNKNNIEIIVYSSFDFLKKTILLRNDVNVIGRRNVFLPNVSFKNFIKHESIEFSVDYLGNVNNGFYKACIADVYRSTNDLDFADNNIISPDAKFEILTRRLMSLKKYFPNAKIIFLLPPIYIERKASIELYGNLQQLLGNKFKNVSIIVPPAELLGSYDYFCDNSHLNDLGREFFSKYLSIQISNSDL